MPTAAQFRKHALSLPDTAAGEHMDHPDFRAHGRIFASLQADGRTAMVRVSPDTQRRLLATHPAAFTPAAGAWGRAGCTMVALAAVPIAVLRDAITAAWQCSREAVASRPTPAPRARAGRARRPRSS